VPAWPGSRAGPERVGPDRPVQPAVHGAEHGGGRQRRLCGGAGGGRRQPQALRGGNSGTLPSPPRWVATYRIYLGILASSVAECGSMTFWGGSGSGSGSADSFL
jgi:hypothetical protein